MNQPNNQRNALQCKLYPLSSLSTYKFVVVCARYEGKWLLSKHKERDTWETQGGHIEQGETPLQAAMRELYEESGVLDATLHPVCDYLGYVASGAANGMLFLAEVHSLGELPESEMEQTQLFETLPTNLTYPNVTPLLIDEAKKLVTP